MKLIKIRQSCADNLFDKILKVDFVENWEIIPIKSKDKNPLVIFKTKKWDKLLNLLNIWIDKNYIKQFTEISKEKDLVLGSLIGLKHHIEMDLKS